MSLLFIVLRRARVEIVSRVFGRLRTHEAVWLLGERYTFEVPLGMVRRCEPGQDRTCAPPRTCEARSHPAHSLRSCSYRSLFELARPAVSRGELVIAGEFSRLFILPGKPQPRRILQRAHDTLNEEIAKTKGAHLMAALTEAGC